jgi:hypothetical protein
MGDAHPEQGIEMDNFGRAQGDLNEDVEENGLGNTDGNGVGGDQLAKTKKVRLFRPRHIQMMALGNSLDSGLIAKVRVSQLAYFSKPARFSISAGQYRCSSPSYLWDPLPMLFW